MHCITDRCNHLIDLYCNMLISCSALGGIPPDPQKEEEKEKEEEL
jgi:hypothetical protein